MLAASCGHQLPRLDDIFKDQPVWSAGKRKKWRPTNIQTWTYSHPLSGLGLDIWKFECFRWMRLVVCNGKPVIEICVQGIVVELFPKSIKKCVPRPQSKQIYEREASIIRGSVYETCVRSVMHWQANWKTSWKVVKAEFWDTWREWDGRQDLHSPVKEVAKRCGLKMIQDKLRLKSLQWFGHVRRETEGGVLRLLEEI